MTETTIHCPAGLKRNWPNPLAEQWASAYSGIFDDDDRRLAQSQPDLHFVEWFAAIHLFQRDGVLSLLEKYGYANHPAKVRRLKSLMPPEDRHFIASFRDQFGVQPPDLLLYRPAERRCWFAEVKGPGDSVSDGQRASWPAITARFGTTVEVVNVVLSADAG